MSLITLNKINFFYNLDLIQAKTGAVEKIALVLKDNAYGHGILEIAQMAKEYGITKVVVRSDAEAKEIEEFFEYILVLADIPKVPSKKIRYTINDMSRVGEYPKETLVELKVNTSMNRNGINADELNATLTVIKKQGLKLEAVFTHHSCADELNANYEHQIENFALVKKSLSSNLRFHSCNSAALFRVKDFNEDMARVGIAAYGCLEMPSSLSKVAFKPVLSLYGDKISQRELQEGESVGYGASFVAEQQCVVSNYDFGYGDGFLRVCSNTYQTPKGTKIAGRISMDNSSFLSDEKRLLIFDDARVVSKYAKTISYEVLTSLKENIKRQIV